MSIRRGSGIFERSSLRRRAREAEANGRVRDAITAWTGLNRFRSDAEVESHLVDLRCEPLDDAVSGMPIEAWPRTLDDPFPDVVGRPPEIDADQLSMEILGGAILHHGCLLVRGLLAPNRVDELRATADRVFAAREEHIDGASPDQTAPWYVPCAHWDAHVPNKARSQRDLARDCNAVNVADSPRALFQLLDALECTNVFDVVSEYLGEPSVLSVEKTMIRRVPPDSEPSWHQDGSFLGAATRAVDVWIALSDCGDGADAPGLGILPERHDASLIGYPTQPHPFDIDQLAATAGGVGPVHPRFAPGDALLFDELLVHANGGGRPGLSRNRYALEVWMFGRHSIPKQHFPILV